MRTPLSLLHILLPALAACPAFAQDSPGQAPVPDVVEVQLVSELDLDPTSLAKALSLKDLDKREAALDDLVAALGVGAQAGAEAGPVKQARTWLEETAKGEGELAWTARLALRELKAGHAAKSAVKVLISDPLLDLGTAGKLPLPSGLAPRPLLPGEAEEEDTIQVWVDEARDGMQLFPVEDVSELDGCTFELRCGPGDVRLRIVEPPESAPKAAEDGQQTWMTRVREYSGKSLGQIFAEHPDLAGLMPFEVPGVRAPKAELRTDVLGVYTRPLDDAVRISLGLPPGIGLDVARIEPGTIAQAIGLERGSVIVELCGHDVTGEDGVSSILKEVREAAMKAGTELEVDVVWYDAWGKRRSRTWRGAASSQ